MNNADPVTGAAASEWEALCVRDLVFINNSNNKHPISITYCYFMSDSVCSHSTLIFSVFVASLHVLHI